MLELFIKGGPIMWPLLVTSVVALGVVIERIAFLITEKSKRDEKSVKAILAHMERRDIHRAIEAGRSSTDPRARVLTYALSNPESSLSNSLLRASALELHRYNRGLTVLDTIITLAPLLGLLGTVTGMIGAFGLLGGSELDAPTAITGGIAEALIATAFGLGVAITALIPFNYLNSALENIRHEIEDHATLLEILLQGEPEPRLKVQQEAA